MAHQTTNSIEIPFNASTGASFRFAFAVVSSIFFAWGFITALNDILIPYLKGRFDLTLFQATLVQFAFFGAYFIGSIVYFVISAKYQDPISKIGYKNGIILGLLIAALGCGLFVPATYVQSYGFFLFALFTLGLGLTLLQIAANPYVALLGKPEGAATRLNLAQGFNSLGTTVAPVIGGYLIFTIFHVQDSTGAEGVRIPYLSLSLGFLSLAVLIAFTKLPKIGTSNDISRNKGEALKHSNLVFGIGAIFFYVGAEVAIGSLLINFTILPEVLGITEYQASKLLALYWGGAMVGRFTGAVAMSDTMALAKKLIMLPLLAGGLYILITWISGLTFHETFPFLGFAALNIVAALIARGLPQNILALFAFIAGALLVTGVMAGGTVAFWAFTATGLFNSIMWSNIFTLSIAGLDESTSQGSSLLVMAIVGGALIPPLQGFVADQTSLQTSYLLPVICYAYILFFGLRGYRPQKRG